jgi:hypothetical protein
MAPTVIGSAKLPPSFRLIGYLIKGFSASFAFKGYAAPNAVSANKKAQLKKHNEKSKCL